MKDGRHLAVLCIWNSLFLPAYRRNNSIWNKGAAPLVQRRRNTIYTFLCYLLVCKGGISMSLVLALQNPTAQAWSTWPRTQWTLAATANYKVLGCTSPNDNKWIVQLQLQICCGTAFQPSCYLRVPYLCKGEVHGTSLISLIWVLIWERGPRTHLQFWDFTTPLLFASREESNLFPKAQLKAELKMHLGCTKVITDMAEVVPLKESLPDEVTEAIGNRCHAWEGQKTFRISFQLYHLPESKKRGIVCSAALPAHCNDKLHSRLSDSCQ